MSFSHNQPLYLSCAPMPRGENKPQPLTAHRNLVRALLSLRVTSSNPYLLTKVLWIKVQPAFIDM